MSDAGPGGTPGASSGGSSAGAGVPGSAGTGVASGGLPASVVCDEPGQQEPELVSTMLTATDEDFVNIVAYVSSRPVAAAGGTR